MRRLCVVYRLFLNLMGQPLRLPRFNMMVVNFDKSRYFSVVFVQTLVTKIKDVFIAIAVDKISFIGGNPRVVCSAAQTLSGQSWWFFKIPCRRQARIA